MSDNLWPDFKTLPQPRTVRRVLLEAGEGLADRTNGRLRCEVDTKPGGKARFVHEGYLVAPALGYRYPLFRVEENGDPYPVTLIGDGTFKQGTGAADESTLLVNLGLLFRSDSTKRTVLELLDIVS